MGPPAAHLSSHDKHVANSAVWEVHVETNHIAGTSPIIDGETGADLLELGLPLIELTIVSLWISHQHTLW